MKPQGLLLVLSGPSGAGKGTICQMLREKLPDLAYSVSVTTRQARNGEVDGVNYFFKSVEEVKQMIAEGELLEYAEVYGNYYGTPRSYVMELLNQGKDVILEKYQGGLVKADEQAAQAREDLADKKLIIYCARGRISQDLAEELRDRGYDAFSLKGGYTAWLLEQMKNQQADEVCAQVEKSIRKKFRKNIWCKFTKAINQYELVKEGDCIAVCISGGKDSMLMAKLFQELKLHNKFPFEVKFVVMDPGYSPENRKVIEENARKLKVPVHIFESDIFESVYHIEKSPCYLCARMRRGYLYNFAKELGCNKIALGHHYDDVIETILMGELTSGAAARTMLYAKGATENQAMAYLQPIVIDTHPLNNPWLNYSVYLCNTLIPGVLMLLIFMVTVYSIGVEIKDRTAREWLRMSNNSIYIALAGKLLPHTIVFFIMGIFYNVYLYGFLHFPCNSGIFPMIFATLCLVLASQCCGIVMIGTLPTLRLGLSFASLWGVISFSISGFSFPVMAMHPVLQALSNLFPLRHYFLIYVDQALNGYSMAYSWTNYMALLIFMMLPFFVVHRLKEALVYYKYIP